MSRLCLLVLMLTTLLFPVQPQAGQSEAVLENDHVRISKALFASSTKSSYVVPPGLSAVVVHLRFLIGVAGAAPLNINEFEYVSTDFFNAGETPREVKTISGSGVLEIRIELKAPAPNSAFEKDAVKLDPSHNKVLFENDRVRVVDVHFGLGEKGPVVDKRPRVIILLNDMHADVARHEGDAPSPRDGKAGVIQWSLGGSQATMNRSETKLDNIVVEIKGK